MTAARRMPAAAAAAAALVLLAACSGEPDPPPQSSAAGAQPVSAAGVPVGHVHNLALDGDAVLMGTHEGIYRQEPGEPPALVGDPFDVMGFTVDGDLWLASGHPSPGGGGPAHLGLIESADSGATWTQVALSGQADFHRLAASQGTVLGVNSGDGLLWRSPDGGLTWATAGPGPFDLALDPLDPSRALGTTAQGPIASTDGGTTWAPPVAGAPVVALLAWTGAGVVGADPDGAVLRSTDAGATWTTTGDVGGEPAAIAADDALTVVLQGGTLYQSTDGGATFTERITGLPGGH